MTVSSVLNGKTGEASEETRARVLKAVDELGYHPNGVARGLARRRMETIGIVASFSDRPSLTGDRYFGPVFDGLLLAAQTQHQRALIITETHWSHLPQNLSRYLDGHCDGLIFVTPTFPSETITPLLKAQIPLVFLGENRPELPVSVIDMDNEQAGALATQKLLELGHRRIAYIGGNKDLRSSFERRNGYLRALEQAGILPDAELHSVGAYNPQWGYLEALRLLTLSPYQRPTALFCGDDSIGVGAIGALQERGYSVPEDFSVVGVNDDQIGQQCTPSLTTIRQPLRTLGEHAVEMLLEQVQDKKLSLRRVLLPGEWVERGSVGPAPLLKGGTKQIT